MKRVVFSPVEIFGDGLFITDETYQVQRMLEKVSTDCWTEVQKHLPEIEEFIIFLGSYPESVMRKAENNALPPDKVTFFAPRGNLSYRESLNVLKDNFGFGVSRIDYCDDFVQICFDATFPNKEQSCH